MNLTIEANVCRLCANSGHDYQSIFDENANSIINKIHNCLPLIIHSDDQLPTQICDPCLEALNISDKLRTQCIQADLLLRKQLNITIENIKQEQKPLKAEELDINFEEVKTYRHVINGNENCEKTFESPDNLHDDKCYDDDSDNGGDVNTNQNLEEDNNFAETNVFDDPLDVEEEVLPDTPNICKTDAVKSTTRCDICNITIKDKKLMELHVKFHQPRPMFCNYCTNTFPSPYELSIHKKLIHKKFATCSMKWFCERCETITSSIQTIKRHLTQCTKKLFSCKYCQQEFAYRLDFISHQKKNHYDLMIDDPNFVKFECDICGKNFVDKATFGFHLRRHRAVKHERHKCTYCEKIFSTRFNLRNHIQGAHERRKVFTCDVCGKMFFTKKNVMRHKHRHNKLTCTECNKNFKSETILDQHLRNDHNAPPSRDKYTCKECNLVFPKMRLLRDHKNIHSGEWPYTCYVCNKSFQSYDARWTHLQMHRKTTFYCDYCQKRFSNKVSLKKHIPWHQAPEDWQYYCEICEVNFRNSEILKRHMQNNENLHRRICDICGFEVLGMDNLRKHRSQKHEIWEKKDSSET